MSLPQDKSKHNSGGSSFGTGKQKNSKTDNKSLRAAIITPIVVAVLFVAALLLNSNFLRQDFAAVKVDGIKYSVVDFDYYFETAYAQYYNAMNGTGSLGQSMLPKQNVSLKSQIYDQSTGETWSDFFKKMAIEQIATDNKTYKAALAAGYQLTDADKKKMESDITSMKQSAGSSGYPDFTKYLQAVFGKGMTEAAYRKNAERTYLISSVYDACSRFLPVLRQ